MADLFRTLLIAAEDAPLARDIAAAFGPGGANMWTTGLAASAEVAPTHYISSGYIPEAFVGLAPYMQLSLNENGEWVVGEVYGGDAATVHEYATQAGLEVTLAEIEAIFSRADVTDQDPHVAMARRGLTIVQPATETEP